MGKNVLLTEFQGGTALKVTDSVFSTLTYDPSVKHKGHELM